KSPVPRQDCACPGVGRQTPGAYDESRTAVMKTVSFNPQTIEREWHLVDLDGLTLGRAASRIALILRGKHKPTYTPHADCGDFVVVVNADKLVLTGTKPLKKVYHRHTGFMGGLKSIVAQDLLAK